MTSWSGFWGDSALTTGSYALQNGLNGRSAVARGIARILNKAGLRKMKEQFDAAILASIGEATVKTHSRVTGEADPTSFTNGGAVSIESVNDMANATIVAAEEANLLTLAQFNPGHNLPIEDSSGNGGGGKQITR